MPQMNPMLWMVLYVLAYTPLVMMMMYIFFSKSGNKTSELKASSLSNSFAWVW